MSGPWDPKSKTISVNQVRNLYPHLSIPHFQRGYVWGNSSVSALLESLYTGVPCGSFVFWMLPEGNTDGVSLDSSSSLPLHYLVIDGQQRIRSLVHAFSDTDLDEEGDQEESIGHRGEYNVEIKRRRWCINLTKVPGLKQFLAPHAKDFSLFVFATDPVIADPRALLRFNIIPWQVIREKGSYEDYRGKLHFAQGMKEDDVFEAAFAQLRQELEEVDNREFFVTVTDTASKSEMISLYNRINSGGKRVEPEERAFARLVGLHDSTWDRVSELFSLIHQSRHGDSDPLARHDDVLQRRKEKNFGFRLFLRTFLQVSHFHFGIAPGSFSFGIVEKSAFTRRLEFLRSDEVNWLWDQTSEVLKCCRNVLEHELFCDSLSFLPESASLMPLFELLIQYPVTREKEYHPVLASLLLRLMIADLGSEDILKMVGQIGGKEHVLERLLPNLMEQLELKVKQRLRQRGDNVLTKADSLQSRYVLLLYLLERRNGARDFSYENLRGGRPEGEEEQVLAQEIDPQKQHIIPFSRLVAALDDEDASRTARHPFNNIGNLTYMSAKLNGFDLGVGNEFLKLELEPFDNLTFHYLSDKGDTGQRVMELYLTIRDIITLEKNIPADAKKLRDYFAEFCAKRQLMIARGFSNWLEDLDAAACQALGVDQYADLCRKDQPRKRLQSVLPRFVSPEHLTAAQVIRRFEYPNDVEDALIGALDLFKGRRNKAADRLFLQFTKRKHVYLEATEDSLTLGFSKKVPSGIKTEIEMVLGVDADSGVIFRRDRPERGAIQKLELAQQLAAQREGEIEAVIEKDKQDTEGNGSKRGKWNAQKFLTILEKRIGQGQGFNIIKALYEFSEKTGTVEWGTGGESGSFTLKVQHPKSQKGLISLITVWTDGEIRFRFGNMRNRVGQKEIERFCEKLSMLPFAKSWNTEGILKGNGPKHACGQALPDEKSLEAFKQTISEYLKEIKK